MKIINDTKSQIHYLVTPSGRPLSQSQVIASGVVSANSTQTVTFNVDPGKGPIVYMGGIEPQYSENFVSTKVTNRDSDVQLKISVINPSADENT